MINLFFVFAMDGALIHCGNKERKSGTMNLLHQNIWFIIRIKNAHNLILR